MKARLLLVASLAVALVGLVPARAATTFVSVYDFSFNPTLGKAAAGDTVTWTWTCGYDSCPGYHNITAWEGASFASGDMSHPASFSATMTNAPIVRYRCTLHSSLTGSSCTGMCASLSADSGLPSGSITKPGSNEIVGPPGVSVPVRFEGTASDDTALASATVRVFDLLGNARDFPAALSPPAPATSANWSATVPLGPGTYLAEVAVRDWVGNTYRSARVRFFVI